MKTCGGEGGGMAGGAAVAAPFRELKIEVKKRTAALYTWSTL